MNVQMSSALVFGLNVLASFAAFAVVAWIYIWPRLLRIPRQDALTALIVPHTFRSIGLSFLLPGVVQVSLPPAFAVPAAYGDLVAAILAFVATMALYTARSWALPIAWVFNVWGAADLLYAFYQGVIGVRIYAGSLGATYFIPTVLVPAGLITHGLIFWLLLRRPDQVR